MSFASRIFNYNVSFAFTGRLIYIFFLYDKSEHVTKLRASFSHIITDMWKNKRQQQKCQQIWRQIRPRHATLDLCQCLSIQCRGKKWKKNNSGNLSENNQNVGDLTMYKIKILSLRNRNEMNKRKLENKYSTTIIVTVIR